MNTKTPEQLEDAAIKDVVNTLVSMELRDQKRRMVNKLMEVVVPQVTKARLQGQSVDVDALMLRLIKEKRSVLAAD